jgi:hypothetical protein
MCLALEAKLAAAPAVTARRLLRPQLRWVGERPDDFELAQRLGVVALVEACRDEHLASLGADDGLAVLAIDWREVVEHACERARIDPAVPRWRRCGARRPRRREPRCKRCGLPGRRDS